MNQAILRAGFDKSWEIFKELEEYRSWSISRGLKSCGSSSDSSSDAWCLDRSISESSGDRANMNGSISRSRSS